MLSNDERALMFVRTVVTSLFIQHYCAMQGSSAVFIGPSEASNRMSLASTGSLVNYLRLPKCMERKSEEQWKDFNEKKAQGQVPQDQMEPVVLYRFDADVLAMKTIVYVKQVLGYANASTLYSDSKNNCGEKYTPNVFMLGLKVRK